MTTTGQWVTMTPLRGRFGRSRMLDKMPFGRGVRGPAVTRNALIASFDCGR